MRVLPYTTALVATLAISLSAASAHAAAIKTDHVEAELLAESTTLVAGADNSLALRLTPEAGWHVYWRNPGDSGLATSLSWTLPDGTTASELQWPYPHRETLGPIVNYGYAESVLMPVTLAVAADVVTPEPLLLRAKAKWLVCKDICIPGSADLELALPVTSDASLATIDERAREDFAKARSELPQPAPADWQLLFQIHEKADEKAFSLAIVGAGIGSADDLSFFPYANDLINHSATTRRVLDADGGLRLSQTLSDYFVKAPASVDGVLVIHDSGGDKAWEIRAVPGPVALVPMSTEAPPVAEAAVAPTAPPAYLLVLLLALLGGLVLNLMPCVFPVLSIKAISLVDARGTTARKQRSHALAYTAGVLATFIGLAGLLIALRGSGAAIGWGFQLQHPGFVAVLAYLFFAMGLSLSGVVEFGTRLMGVGQSLASAEGYRGSFFTGVLAVAVASPCTAPFMGTALGYALSQPAFVALTVFAALGLGLALPFLAIGFVPAFAKALPRPGKWMETFKQFMAFPLYLTTVWLLWVLGGLTDRNGMTVALLGLTLIAFALWLWPRSGVFATLLKFAAVASAIALLATPLLAKQVAGPAVASAEGDAHEPYSEARLAELRAEGRSVFVNFTADWCITCKVNERVALASSSVRQSFKERKVVWLEGDWTREDPLITKTLARFGRSGVPLYLVYAGNAEPAVLPQLLTPDIVIGALPPPP